MARRFAKVAEEEIVAINEVVFFIHLIWEILKQLSPSGWLKSSGHIPRRFASPYIFSSVQFSSVYFCHFNYMHIYIYKYPNYEI